MGCYDCCFLTLHDKDSFVRIESQKVLTKETLLQFESLLFQFGVYPTDMGVWLFHPSSRIGIIKHYLATADFPQSIYLPKDSGAIPFSGCTHFVESKQLVSVLLADSACQENA